jgi:hypothetical protein
MPVSDGFQAHKILSLFRFFSEVHMSVHRSSVRSLPCELCKHLFKNTKSLFAHYKEKHTDRERKHVCDLCGKSFRDGYHLGRKVFQPARLNAFSFFIFLNSTFLFGLNFPVILKRLTGHIRSARVQYHWVCLSKDTPRYKFLIF